MCCAEDLDVQKECDGKPAMAAIEAAAVAAVGGGWVVNEHGENSRGNAAPSGNDACETNYSIGPRFLWGSHARRGPDAHLS